MNKINDYTFLKEIGSGVTSKVQKAQKDDSEVAIKIVEKQMIKEYYGKTNYEELEILKIVDHPNLIKLIEIVETDTTYYIVTELLKSVLFDYLEFSGFISEIEAKVLFQQIVLPIKYLHEKKICHRDLKLENLMFDSEGNLKLLDFGFSKFFNPEQLCSSYCGSPDYASPELWLREPYVGPEVDIWALGVILYIMVTGYVPFSSPSHASQIKYSYPSSPILSDSIKKLMSKIFKKKCERVDILKIEEDEWFNFSNEKEEKTIEIKD